jgi:hypothetical protein
VHIDERLDKEQNLDQKVDSVMNKLKWGHYNSVIRYPD